MAQSRGGFHRPAGGYGSRNVRHTSVPKVEPRARGQNPSAVAQLGSHVGDHTTNNPKSTGYRGEQLVRGAGYNNPVGPSSMALSGPGSGRNIMKTGSQAMQGAANPGNPRPVPSGHIISSFGPDKSGS
jgi:hypothetical protein